MRSLIPVLAIAATGCVGMINKKIETQYTQQAVHWQNEDIDAIVADLPDSYTHVLPTGQVLESKQAYKDYLKDLFQANDEIEVSLKQAFWGGDAAVILYEWTSKVVQPSEFYVDMVGTKLAFPGVSVLYLNDERKIDRIEDYFDNALLAGQAGYALLKPQPKPVPSPAAPAPDPKQEVSREPAPGQDVSRQE